MDAFETELSQTAGLPVPLDLAPCRHAYWVNAIRALAAGETPESALWPLIKVWTDLTCAYRCQALRRWQDCLEALQLNKEHLDQKAEGLDDFLDNVELVLETWANAYV